MDIVEKLEFCRNFLVEIEVCSILSPEDRAALIGTKDISKLRESFLEAIEGPKRKDTTKYGWLENAAQTVKGLVPWLR